MGMTTIYKEDMSSVVWASIVADMELPFDTDEICIKHVSHITEIDRQNTKTEKENASNNN